jgi:hypothetical protein
MWNLISVRLEKVLVSYVRQVLGLRQTYRRLRNRFERT